jgi:hypothetical protein
MLPRGSATRRAKLTRFSLSLTSTREGGGPQATRADFETSADLERFTRPAAGIHDIDPFALSAGDG